MKNSSSICSNSRERKVKLRGVTSLRNALPIWQMPNGTFCARGVEHVLELREDGLRGLGAEIGLVFVAGNRADEGVEHQVERPWLRLFLGAFGHRFAGPLRAAHVLDLIGAETALARFAIDHRIAECVHMARRLPDRRVHDDAGIEADDVLALAGHRLPPGFAEVALQFGAQRAVIPKTVDPAVDLRRLENEAPVFAETRDFLHQGRFFGRLGHGVIGFAVGIAGAKRQ